MASPPQKPLSPPPMPDRGCSYPPPTAGTSPTRTPERPTRSIYDLEDGVVPSARPTAREALHLWFSRGGTGWVRVNPPAPRTGAMTSTHSRQHPGSWA